MHKHSYQLSWVFLFFVVFLRGAVHGLQLVNHTPCNNHTISAFASSSNGNALIATPHQLRVYSSNLTNVKLSPVNAEIGIRVIFPGPDNQITILSQPKNSPNLPTLIPVDPETLEFGQAVTPKYITFDTFILGYNISRNMIYTLTGPYNNNNIALSATNYITGAHKDIETQFSWQCAAAVLPGSGNLIGFIGLIEYTNNIYFGVADLDTGKQNMSQVVNTPLQIAGPLLGITTDLIGFPGYNGMNTRLPATYNVWSFSQEKFIANIDIGSTNMVDSTAFHVTDGQGNIFYGGFLGAQTAIVHINCQGLKCTLVDSITIPYIVDIMCYQVFAHQCNNVGQWWNTNAEKQLIYLTGRPSPSQEDYVLSLSY